MTPASVRMETASPQERHRSRWLLTAKDVELFGTFKHTVDRFLGYTATVSDVLLTETQACQTQDLSVLGHMSDLLRIIYAVMAHTIILRRRMCGFHCRIEGFQSLESRFPIYRNSGF